MTTLFFGSGQYVLIVYITILQHDTGNIISPNHLMLVTGGS